ncbi:MAG: hypothetical protein ACFHU9_02620 [Fluviicola sp.]
MEEDDALESFDILDEDLDRSPQHDTIPGTLVALCILTMVGSVFILFKDFITYQFYEGYYDLPLVYGAEVLACIACIGAAILMLLRRLIGFYIYVGSSIIYVAAILWFWLGIMDFEVSAWTILLIFVYVAAPIGFVIMYSYHKKYLH